MSAPILRNFSLRLVLLLAAFFFSAANRAHADAAEEAMGCTPELCDLDSVTEGFRALGSMNYRFNTIAAYRRDVQQFSDVPYLKNVAELARRVKALCIELQDEDWVVREADGLAADALLQVARSPDVVLEDLNTAFHGMETNEARTALLRHWGDQIPTLATEAELMKLIRFFEFAKSDCGWCERWVPEIASSGLDEAAKRLLTESQFKLTLEKTKSIFHIVSGSNGRHVILTDWRTKVEESANDRPKLLHYLEAFDYAYADSEGGEIWIRFDAQIGLELAASKLVLMREIPVKERIGYFSRIPTTDGRGNLLRQLSAEVLPLADKGDLLVWLPLLEFARDNNCAGCDRWITEEAQSGINILANRIFKNFDPTLSEAKTVLHEVGGETPRHLLLLHLTQVAHQNAENEGKLLFLYDLFEFAIPDSSRFEGWVASTAMTGLQTVATSLIKRPVINAREMMKYFKVIDADGSRHVLLTYWANRVKRYEDKKSLLELSWFFHLAEMDCLEHSADWVVYTARIGAETAISRLSQLFPVYEGVYEVVSECDASGCGKLPVDRVVIMDSLNGHGFQISLVNGASGLTLYSFSDADPIRGGHGFSQTSQNGAGALTQLDFDFDPETLSLSGRLVNSDHEEPITFKGKQMVSTVALYDLQASRKSEGRFPKAIPEELILRGTFGGNAATLVVGSMDIQGNLSIGAALTLDEVRHHRFNFQNGRFNPKNGMLILVGSQVSGNRSKLVLATRVLDDGRLEAHGLLFNSINGVVKEISLLSEPSL